MGKFSFIPQIRKDLNNEKNHPSFDSQKSTDEMIFTTLFDNYPDAVFIVDMNGEIIHVNKSVKSLFGLYRSNYCT